MDLSGAFLVVQWLRLHTESWLQRVGIPFLVRDLKICVLHGVGKKKKKSICLAFKPTCLLNNNIFKLSGFFFFLGNYKIILCDYVIWEICEFKAQLFYHSACSHFCYIWRKNVSNLTNIWALFSLCDFELELSVLMVQTLLWMRKLTQRLLHQFLSSRLRTQPALEELDHNFSLSLCRSLIIS